MNMTLRSCLLLEKDGKILLTRHRKGNLDYFLLPGGHVHPGERLADAAMRECYEETGLRVRAGELLHVCDVIGEAEGRHIIQFVFRGASWEGEARQTGEDERVAEVLWMEREALLGDLPFYPDLRSDLIALLDGKAACTSLYRAAPWKPLRGLKQA